MVRLGVTGLDHDALPPSSADTAHRFAYLRHNHRIGSWPPCPLTVVESWLEARAGIEPAHGPFLVHVLDAVVYPDLPEWLIVGCAVLVCVTVLWVYLRRYHRRTACGEW